MTFIPPAASITNPFFSAYRSTDQSPTIPGDYQADNFLNCSEDSSNSGKVKLTRASYMVGEIRASLSSSSSSYPFQYDIVLSGSDELAEGYQVRCNAVASLAMDDACYGVGTSGASICVRAKNKTTSASTPTDPSSLANEIRIMGLKTK